MKTGSARQKVCPETRSQGRGVGPQNRSVSLYMVPLPPPMLSCPQEEKSQTKGHADKTYEENCEAWEPGCWGHGSIPSQLVPLGKGPGVRAQGRVGTGEAQAQVLSTHRGPVIRAAVDLTSRITKASQSSQEC